MSKIGATHIQPGLRILLTGTKVSYFLKSAKCSHKNKTCGLGKIHTEFNKMKKAVILRCIQAETTIFCFSSYLCYHIGKLGQGWDSLMSRWDWLTLLCCMWTIPYPKWGDPGGCSMLGFVECAQYFYIQNEKVWWLDPTASITPICVSGSPYTHSTMFW